ncbi:MAG: sialate O-acetylesterase [Planctomycetota bacterium]|nr:sialate O-acetylesterase [Planctomycetota bacterium]
MAKRSFEVDSGLSPNQVLARDAAGFGRAALSGTCAHAGTIQARLLAGKEPKLDWRDLAPSAGGDAPWSGVFDGLPAGGPYTVEARVAAQGAELGRREIKPVFVGDLWVLAGQSNMQGIGNLDARMERPHKLVSCYALRESWERASEPLHPLIESPDSCHWSCAPEDRPRLIEEARRTRTKGAGLGLAFAKELVKRIGVPIGLIPCAHGGTSMQQWSPERRHEGGASLYGSMLRRVAAAGGRVKGVLWYQGESECGPEAAPRFVERFTNLIACIREDLGAPELPFLYVQIARFVHRNANAECWNRVREAQLRCEGLVPHAAMVGAIDLPLDDAIHISTDGLKRLGKRLADAACRVVYGANELRAGPRLKAARFMNAERTRLKLSFAGVHGKLVSPRRVGGFSACDAEGAPMLLIFDSYVDPDDPNAVVLKLEPVPPPGAKLYYGAGADSFCTLLDERDHAAPAFGPLALDDVPVG